MNEGNQQDRVNVVHTKERSIKERKCKRMKNKTEQKEGANNEGKKQNRKNVRMQEGRCGKKQEEDANERKKRNMIKDGANEPTNKKETEQTRRCECTKETNKIQRRWD